MSVVFRLFHGIKCLKGECYLEIQDNINSVK